MQVRLLGPVDVTVDGAARPVLGLRRKAVLAVLGLRPGETVSADHLIEVVWGDDPPVNVTNALQSHVSYLRGVLGARPAIAARKPGYVLDLGDDATDLVRAERLIARGRQATDPAEGARHLRAALALWRGRPLADVDALVWLHRQADRLAELHLDAVRLLVEARLVLGEHTRLVPELEHLVHQHPFDEHLTGQLMRAQYRTGRRADALKTYHRLRDKLDADLGIEPGPALRDLETAILRQDPGLDPPSREVSLARRPARPVPAQLPLESHGFVGRAAELADLGSTLDGAGRPAVVAVVGAAGVGKTALAVRWAHRIAARFPDGQLYADLCGFDPVGAAADPADAVRSFLDTLGVPVDRVPADLDARAAFYRSLLAGKRMLVLLDNARDASQVRPLLPGSPGCLTIVTSRNQLTPLVAIEGARPLRLEVLTDAESRQLLTRAGTPCAGADPGAVAAVVDRCGGLPLALAIAAARAAIHPGSTLAGQPALDALHGGDAATDLRAVFSSSHRILSPGAARLFRLLGLHRGPDIGLDAAAGLAGVAPAELLPLLDELVRVSLIAEHRPRRYAMHRLVRAYAAEQARRPAQ